MFAFGHRDVVVPSYLVGGSTERPRFYGREIQNGLC